MSLGDEKQPYRQLDDAVPGTDRSEEVVTQTQAERAAAVLDAQAEYQAAGLAMEKAAIDVENGYMNGGPSAQVVAVWRALTSRHAEALLALVRARKAALPTFEQMLTDPTVQADPEGRILASIQAYKDAPPASATWPKDAP